MKTKKFLIESDKGEILYDPAGGIIRSGSMVKRTISRKSSVGLFPRYLNSSEQAVRRNFRPHCLTLYTTNQCNLSCQYCYVREKPPLPHGPISRRAVKAAAEFVAPHCERDRVPFVLGFHGGDEPLLHPEVVQDCVTICAEVAERNNLQLLAYCTTNGVLPENVVQWAAKTFHGIRLSWDGPPDIHDRFRALGNGDPTSRIVERSAKILLGQRSNLSEFVVRCTITNESVDRLSEIVQYFYEEGVRWVEVYPVFQDLHGSIPARLMPPPHEFVRHFLQARQWSRRHGMRLQYSGSRLMDLHDKHCNVLHNNLTITPDGHLSSCFLATHNHDRGLGFSFYGYYDEKEDTLVIDWPKLASTIDCVGASYPQCEGCFNFLHCVKGCPSVCPLNQQACSSPTFDCTSERWIGLSNILEAVYGPPRHSFENIDELFSTIKVTMIPS